MQKWENGANSLPRKCHRKRRFLLNLNSNFLSDFAATSCLCCLPSNWCCANRVASSVAPAPSPPSTSESSQSTAGASGPTSTTAATTTTATTAPAWGPPTGPTTGVWIWRSTTLYHHLEAEQESREVKDLLHYRKSKRHVLFICLKNAF